MAGSTRRALALLVCFGAASVGADYGATSPKSLSIVLDALTSGLGEEGQEFPVAKDGAVMENWAAVTENLADDWDTTVTLHNIEVRSHLGRRPPRAPLPNASCAPRRRAGLSCVPLLSGTLARRGST